MRGLISFVFSSPRHHAQILLPVVRTLRARKIACQVVSIAELRGLSTPKWDLNGAETRRLLPMRRPVQVPRPAVGKKLSPVNLRAISQAALWNLALAPRFRWLLRGSSVVVIPNDVVFPYVQLVGALQSRQVPVVLVQEGIRFRLPTEESTIEPYGTKASKVCVWGEGSAEHFRAIGVPDHNLCVTGNPRFDGLDVDYWKSEGAKALASLGVERAPLLYLSNPLEIQGYGDIEFKLNLFATFLRESSEVLGAHQVPILVTLHHYEDPAAFRAVANRLGVPITIADNVPMFALLAAARAAVVTASTAGLEALVFEVPLGVLELPSHGFAFEYVERGAAVGLRPGALSEGVAALLRGGSRIRESREFVQRHLANRGTASELVSDAILSVVRS